MSQLRYLNAVLTVLCGLLALNLYTGWASSDGFTTEAHAQGIPDEGAQRAQMIDQLKLLNGKIDSLNATIQSGKVKVTVTNLDAAE